MYGGDPRITPGQGGPPGGFPPGFGPGGPGGGPGGGFQPGPGGPGGPGQGPSGPPQGPPPSFTPQQGGGQGGQFGVQAVDPGSIRGCLYRYTYVWLDNRQRFWFYPTYVGRRSVSGYRWTGFFWVYYGIDLRRIDSFQCY
ncbi:transporter [Piscibacillus sp. B03]|uniref:transporter n=1 Tax=Piscibacillus sp. B03 TaxID=3457430 RepID=UPI003FCD2041